MSRVAKLYAACAVVALAALVCATWSAFDASSRARETSRFVAHLLRLRLALWPADGAATALLVREATLESGWFRSGMSPADDPPYVRARCVLDLDGRIVAPLPPRVVRGEIPDQSAPLRALDLRPLVAGSFHVAQGAADPPLAVPEPFASPNLQIEGVPPVQRHARQAERDFENRGARNAMTQNLAVSSFEAERAKSTTVRGAWLGDGDDRKLFLLRGYAAPGEAEVVYATWIDGDALAAELIAALDADHAGARLIPTRDYDAPVYDRMATLPFRIELPAADAPAEFAPETRIFLPTAWLAVCAAIVGGAFLIRASDRLSARRARFVSAVTHELRTPLTTFRLYADLLAGAAGDDPAKRAEYLTTLQAESARLARVVESVLLYSRLEEGSGGVRSERTDAAELVERCLPPLARRAAEAGFTLATDVEGVRGKSVMADAQAVEQILYNLVDNACKYATDGARRIELTSDASDRWTDFVVADDGPGVPRAERTAIFESFRRGKEHAAGGSPGAGLGLALARSLARAQGGDLILDAERAKGAAFRLRLPTA